MITPMFLRVIPLCGFIFATFLLVFLAKFKPTALAEAVTGLTWSVHGIIFYTFLIARSSGWQFGLSAIQVNYWSIMLTIHTLVVACGIGTVHLANAYFSSNGFKERWEKFLLHGLHLPESF